MPAEEKRFRNFIFALALNYICFQINLQDVSIEDMEWNFDDHRHWQILLTDESIVDFVNRSETPDQLSSANINLCARYLDMPISWVDQFTVSNAGDFSCSVFLKEDQIIFFMLLQSMMNVF